DIATLTVILGLLAIEAKWQIVPLFGQRDRRRRRKSDPLVRRSEKLVKSHTGCKRRFGVELSEAAQALAVVEQSRVEKVRRKASGLGDKVTETQHIACQ